ncbi:hypothetical protein ASPBRDRAFT_674307 [Aspergillus brasiliensis CBS 101740]|uniref:Uncharacterized protein n=1 Tax=Aspergillus brasiliensis (strain CBS 101740 / IMI 381727 / IBT 21946) TaxID=767769 RepID=A0A1L9UJ68_ASPBC|nr:hypothetical protein ASPBRDRAFT_674307 [Aspergillus brasiliensis CBS 101740]
MRLTTLLFILVHLLALTSAAMTGNFMGMGSAFNFTQTAAQRLQQLAGHLVPDRSTGNATKDYVVQHPFQVASSILGFAFPGVLLKLVGYGPLGPYAGSLASWSQSYLGNPVARSFRAYLQSAAMNGYAAAPVVTTVRGVIVSAWGYLAWKDGFGGKGEQQHQQPQEERQEKKSR